MKKAKLPALVGIVVLSGIVALSLSGCGYNLEELAIKRDRCHELGGTFKSWNIDGFDNYNFECDLSDKEENR